MRVICIFGIDGGVSGVSMPPIMAMAVIKGNQEKAMGHEISLITTMQGNS